MTEEIKAEEPKEKEIELQIVKDDEPTESGNSGVIPPEFRVKFGTQLKKIPYVFHVPPPPKVFTVKNVNISIDGNCTVNPTGAVTFEIHVGDTPAHVFEYAPVIEVNQKIETDQSIRFMIQPKENLFGVLTGELAIELEG